MSYPISIISDVFDNPEQILSLAQSMDYTKDENNVSNSGIRETSSPLHEILPELYHTVMSSTLLNFYENIDPFTAQGTCYFHRTFGDQGQQGYVHRDTSILTSVIYLNQFDHNNGIEIYKPCTLNGNTNDVSKLDKIAVVNAHFNSMIVFPGHYPHRPLMSQSDQYRYTIRLFIKKLCSTASPLQRMRLVKG